MQTHIHFHHHEDRHGHGYAQGRHHGRGGREFPARATPELMSARRDLEEALSAKRDATPEEHLRIAAILMRAATDIASTDGAAGTP